ncbi:uncharacterized protein [Coffea arabica]|uniref:Reverse transcriptase domain-containing protein n=1 Tax=Coffea arabica TaxID=13443 RepID=A0ABM4U610_COFAR
MSQPWIAVGDFNVIASSDEREGEAPANTCNMEEFNTSMFKCGLSSLAFDGSRFTWTNGSVWQQLDRALGMQVQGVGMAKFFKKLMAVRKALRRWNRKVFGNVTSTEARAIFNKALAQRCAFWRQKAGVRWLQERDANTAYFHSLVRQRRNTNFISQIMMDDRGWCESLPGIKASAITFFSRLFSSNGHQGSLEELPFDVPSIGAANNAMMKDLLTLEEFHSVVFSLDIDSAPSSNGFGAGFYQCCWSTTKDDLIEATGFIPGRGIFDNILLAQELIHELDRRLVDPNLVLKLDLEKAYDRVDWSFLLFMLRQFGFDEQAIPFPLCEVSSSRYYVSAGLWVPYLAFADDTIIFTRCSADTLTAIKDLLQLYQACSGQKVLSPPRAIVASLAKICNGFLWDNSVESKRIYWAAWEKVCFPLGETGLGFRSFDAMVHAFSCKLCWYLRENKTIWPTFMHSKYIKGNHPHLVAVDRPSPVWRRLVQVRDLAERNIQWSLGEGLVDFWHDRWCTDVPLAILVSGSACPHMLVGELYRPYRWDEHHLRQLFPGHIVMQILKLQIFLGLKDKMVWGASS